MYIENKMIEGDIDVSSPLTLHGMAKGNVTVVNGGILHLHGMCLKNLYVKSGGAAIVYGMVNGDVANDGGVLEVHGTVQGAVNTIQGQTTISPKAIVVRGVNQAGETSQAVGLIGGAALGAAIGGPVGAVVGGVLGAILGKEGKGLG